jgi:hypothetical protein
MVMIPRVMMHNIEKGYYILQGVSVRAVFAALRSC